MPTDGPEAVAKITTERLELVSMSLPFMRALVAGDIAGASREIRAAVPDGMPDDLVNFLRYRIAQVELDPTVVQWLGRAIVLPGRKGERQVIGTIGFHGTPDAEGRLEVGYRVEPAFRRRGFAREAVRAMFDWAATEHGVRRFIASVSPTNDASLALIAGLGFSQTGSQMDDIDGLELVFEAEWPPAANGNIGVPSR